MSETSFVPVIFAGGAGTRLWPLSRRSSPKPFVRLADDRTLLERSWSRALGLADPESIFVAVEGGLAPRVHDLLPELPRANVIVEPVARDTGPAAVHAAWTVHHRRPGSAMAMIPADHRIADEAAFRRAVAVAHRTAREQEALVCIGVPPDHPTSAFGYIVCAAQGIASGEAVRASRFEEKPSRERAEGLIAAEGALWNSGIFVWRPEVLMEEAMRHSAELSGPLAALRDGGDTERFFRDVPQVSIDRAVLERSGNVWVVGARMGWDDLGSWDSLAKHLPADGDGNSGVGRHVLVESRDCFVHSEGKPVVVVGLEGVVIIERDDVVLVANRSEAQKLRGLPEILRRQGLGDLL